MAESMRDRAMRTIFNSDKPTKGIKRVELIAVADDIRAGLREGLTLRMVHQTLVAERKISCSYERLRDFVATDIREPKRKKDQALQPLSPIPGSETLSQKPRAWNSRPDPKEIF